MLEPGGLPWVWARQLPLPSVFPALPACQVLGVELEEFLSRKQVGQRERAPIPG